MKYRLIDLPSSLFGKKGFTLLELLISVTLIGIMVFILAAVLRLGYRSVEAGEKKMDYLERLRSSLHLIEAQVQSQLPLTYQENGEKRLYFQGKATRLEFSAPFSIWEGEKGLVVVSYRVEEGAGGKKSLRAVENRIGQEETREITLLDSCERLDFEYFYQSPTDETGQWLEEWTETSLLPKKIRLNVLREGKDLSLLLPVKTAVADGKGLVPPSSGEIRKTP